MQVLIPYFHAKGVCDDVCRTEQCSFDGADCLKQEMCGKGTLCLQMLQVWELFLPGQYVMDQATLCGTVYPLAVESAGYTGGGSCNQLFLTHDYNQDSHINFREFVAIAGSVFDTNQEKWAQANCSQCIGVENYNLYYRD